jgi:hypothetical protein
MKHFVLSAWFVFAAVFQSGAATWNVIDFGARGDAIQTLASCVSNSTLVSLETTNTLSGADVGKLIELFGAGVPTSGTNAQDLIAYILSVTNGNLAIISVAPHITATNLNCTFGTQNAGAFQSCVNACTGSNAVISIPAGRYLMVPPQVLETNFVMSSSATICLAVTVSKGGITFKGNSPGNTILLGNGAWTLMPSAVERGALFGCVGPVTNEVDAPLVFENLTFDGGVQVGNLGYGSGPANPVDGTGWDITHDAVVDLGQPPYHANQQLINCQLVHWRGEIIKSVVSWDDGFIGVTNCVFSDGDGSGFNFNWTPHVISGCLFSNLNMAMEYYVGTMRTNSLFENSVITNTRIAIVLVGALTNHPSPGYSIISNSISASQYGICLGPARNVIISGNTFYGGAGGVATDGYAYQGNDYNQNILVENNRFVNCYYPLIVGGAGADVLVNMTWLTNTATGCASFAYGESGWSSNLVFLKNISLNPAPNQIGQLNSLRLTGQWFVDDASDSFPSWFDSSVASNGVTNTVSYVYGMRHTLSADSPQAVFLLDNSQPGKIPPGAELVLTNASHFSVSIYPTSANPAGKPFVLPSGNTMTCVWSNIFWQFALVPPANLQAIQP